MRTYVTHCAHTPLYHTLCINDAQLAPRGQDCGPHGPVLNSMNSKADSAATAGHQITDQLFTFPRPNHWAKVQRFQ